MRRVIRFDHTNLIPEMDGIRFNATIIESNGGYLLAFRNAWIKSQIYAARLDKDFKPTGEHKRIPFPNGAISKGKEDPRWFRLGGALHLWAIMFSGRSTQVCYGKVNEDTLDLESFYWPQNPEFKRFEKNHAYFEYHGIPHSIYSISPHRIMSLAGAEPGLDPQARFIHETPFNGTWSGGYLRGGASPVLHNGAYYHFFHGSIDQPNKRRLYNCGVYTFSPEPPFNILRYTPKPIDVADPAVEPKAEKHDVIFPGGAIFVDGQWCIAYGVNDSFIELRFYDEAEIESQLIWHPS